MMCFFLTTMSMKVKNSIEKVIKCAKWKVILLKKIWEKRARDKLSFAR